MKFETWLKLQKKRDDQVGDLAQDYLKALTTENRKPYAERFSEKVNYQILDSMLHWQASYAAYNSLDEAWLEYCEAQPKHFCFYKEMLEFMEARHSQDEEE